MDKLILFLFLFNIGIIIVKYIGESYLIFKFVNFVFKIVLKFLFVYGGDN